MKSDARLLLNKKKWNKMSGNSNTESWKIRDLKFRGTVDARKILNLKRKQRSKAPVVGSYMRTKTATALIASQIRKEIASVSKVPEKRVHLSSDGNIIVTSKSKNLSQTTGKKGILQHKMDIDTSVKNRSLQNNMQYEPSTSDMDDLEHMVVGDLLDLETLPPAYVSSKTLQTADLSRKSLASHVLEKKHTMVADQVSSPAKPASAKVYVSNLHPSVSKQDIMELFGDVGIIRNAEILTPGTAVIDFYDEEDAEKACDIYHNRLLDGLPMKCYIQNSSQPQKSAISQRLGNRVFSDPNSIQKTVTDAVLTNSRSRYNPRNVQFTVKLT